MSLGGAWPERGKKRVGWDDKWLWRRSYAFYVERGPNMQGGGAGMPDEEME